MHPLRNIMGEERWLKPLINHTQVLRQIRLNWSEVMGALSPHFTADYLFKSELVITAHNPVWAAEIRYFTPMIVLKLQSFDPGITGLRVKMASSRPDGVLPSTTPTVADVPLPDLIRRDIESKLAKGFVWCPVCQSVLTQSASCLFCRCESASSTHSVPLDSPL